jgi:thiol-disulfide isomerase/thioredoxin
MYRIVLCLLISTVFVNFSFAQKGKKPPPPPRRSEKPIKKGVFKMIYTDENDNFITKDEFDAKLNEIGYDWDRINDERGFGAKLIKAELLDKPVPAFSIKLPDGKIIDNEQIKGKVTVLNFWFISCIGCVAEMPALNNLKSKYKDNAEVQFIAPTHERRADVNKFLLGKQFDFEIATDAEQSETDLKIDVFPVTIIINREGQVVYWKNGGDKRIDKRIEQIINRELGK